MSNDKLIRQRTNDQCAIAAIAMATGLDYDYVLNMGLLTGNYTNGNGTHTASLLNSLSVPYKSIYDHSKRISNTHWAEMLWGRRALLSVESINNEGGTHIVFWNYSEILDPQNGNEFDGVVKNFFTMISDNMKIQNALLICECPKCEVKPKWNITPILDTESDK